MFTLKKIISLALIISMVTACGEGSLESDELGLASECYLNDNGDNQPLLNTFSGKIVAGGVASLSLGSCVNPEEGITLSAVSVDDESMITAEISDDTILLTSQRVGEVTLTVSREGADNVSFKVKAVEATEIKTDVDQSGAMALDSSFKSRLQFFAGDTFLAGGRELTLREDDELGVRVEQLSPTQIKLTAEELGSHSVELESAELTIEVIEQHEAIPHVVSLLGDSIPISSDNVLNIGFNSPSELPVYAIGELRSPSVISTDESVCTATFSEDSNQVIFVDGLSVGECELTVSFEDFSITHTLAFTEAVEEAPAE